MPGRYSAKEERAHTLIHGIGLLLSIGGLIMLITSASQYHDPLHTIGIVIYGTTLILLYASSTLYHGIPHARAKPVLQRLDHMAIFALIAGTYTPFTLVNLRGIWGWSLFGLVWSIAIAGMALELFARKRHKRLSVSLYLGLGWLVLIAVKPMLQSVEVDGLLLLLTGGLFYSFGVIFYVWKSLTYHHAIWHLFVLAGSAAHFVSVLFYVQPPTP